MATLHKHINFEAYSEHEMFFGGRQEVEEYRNAKLQNVQKNVNFIIELFNNKKINVLELASGNSKFLYALQNSSMLKSGSAIEISKSRHNFAEDWKSSLHANNITNINANIIELDFDALPSYDLVYCVDLAYQLMTPVGGDIDTFLLQNIYNKLEKGGRLVLELDDHNRIMTNMMKGEARLWQEFDTPDPWRFMLWHCVDEAERRLRLKKTFIQRDLSRISSSEVILKNYTRREASYMLKQHNFKNIRIHDFWDTAGDLLEDEFIITGQK